MTLTLPKIVEQKVKGASQTLGISERDFLVNAVLYYAQALDTTIDLQNELRLWENASQEDLEKFERAL